MAENYVKVSEYQDLQRRLDRLRETLRKEDWHTKIEQAYDNGRQDAKGEAIRSRTIAESGDDIAHLRLPDNGGTIQFHVVGPTGPNGPNSLAGKISLRIWGPPDASGTYGVHEQGGGNISDMSMLFDLDERGITVDELQISKRRKW